MNTNIVTGKTSKDKILSSRHLIKLKSKDFITCFFFCFYPSKQDLDLVVLSAEYSVSLVPCCATNCLCHHEGTMGLPGLSLKMKFYVEPGLKTGLATERLVTYFWLSPGPYITIVCDNFYLLGELYYLPGNYSQGS